jgi:hypothetical protein
MSRIAEAMSKIEELEDAVKFHAEECRRAKTALHDISPAMEEIQGGLCGSMAILHALEVYLPGGQLSSALARALRGELERLRQVAEANLVVPASSRRAAVDFAEEPTVEIDGDEEE